jgi:chromosome segregation ATPase
VTKPLVLSLGVVGSTILAIGLVGWFMLFSGLEELNVELSATKRERADQISAMKRDVNKIGERFDSLRDTMVSLEKMLTETKQSSEYDNKRIDNIESSINRLNKEYTDINNSLHRNNRK